MMRHEANSPLASRATAFEWLSAALAALAWIACGAMAALGLIGAYGVSVVFFALVPAVLFGVAAALAARRLGRGWREGLSTVVFSAGVNAMVMVVLITLPKGI